MTVAQFPDRAIVVDGKQYLYFGGTSYLGMATHPEFQDCLFKSIQRWGTAYGSSRNSNIKLEVYEKAENLLSEIVGAEAVVTLSSGTLAGKLVIDFLAKEQRSFYHYPKTHPAVLSPTSRPLFVDGELHPKLTDATEESIVITADAILSLEVKPTDFGFLDQISATKHLTLVIDESHSLGVVGADGAGVFGALDHPKISKKIMIGSLTKAYGCSGGMIGGDAEVIESIRQDAVFISASGMNPIFLQTFMESQELLEIQQKKLKANLKYFYGGTPLPGQFKYDSHYPVVYCHSDAIYDYLKTQGIIITNFKYPNYETMMNRIVLTANHTQTDLERLKVALLQFDG